MASAKRSTRKRHPFDAPLAALGCTFWETCHAYTYAGHVDRVSPFDRHTTFVPAPVTLTSEWPAAAAAA